MVTLRRSVGKNMFPVVIIPDLISTNAKSL
jgi:hypothetical protein